MPSKILDASINFNWKSDLLKLRSGAITQFLESESLYVRELKAIKKGLLRPLEKSSLLSSNDKWTLTSNLKTITENHRQFLRRWKEKVTHAKTLSVEVGKMDIGELALDFVKDLNEYQIYCPNTVSSELLFNRIIVRNRFSFSSLIVTSEDR